MSQGENEPPKENPQPESEVKPKEEEEEEQNETFKESPIKRIFHHERVNKYYKDQHPPLSRKQKFIDQIFPPIIDSLHDRSNRRTGVDKINVQEIDWKKASELFPKLCLFPNKTIKIENSENEYVEFKINFKQNKGELFSNYTHFFHAVSLMTSIPGLIENIFKTKTINAENCYELYVYIKGQYQIVILDDYLPVVKNTTFLRFSKPNKEEIWLPLLEKAYAKTHGGYGSLITCDTASVIQCFTGLPVERINISDLDSEDLKIVLKNNLEHYIFLTPNSEKCKDIGIVDGKAYQLREIFDFSSDKRDIKDDKEEKNNIILKIYNMFEYNQYKGKWSAEGESFTEEIKSKVKFNAQDKKHIYMPFEYLSKYFKQINIVYKLFDSNIKQITVSQDSINTPQVFNLYIQNDSKVSFSLIFRNSNYDSEMSEYEQSLKKIQKICPACICISEYNLEEKKFINFDGCYNSENGPETARNLKPGFYILWTYVALDFCSNPKPTEYDLKVCSHENFKLKSQAEDTKFHLLKNILYSGIKQYQGQFINSDEITVMDDNYYNFTGLGFEIIINPFKDYFQKWVFKTQVKNIALLYPYSKFEHFEIQVLPENFFLLVGIKIDNTKKCQFSMKSFFKTLKYDENLIEKPENININFEDFCSEEVQKDERDFQYYQYLNDEGVYLESQEFRTDKVVYDHLYNNYTVYMNKINELSPLNQKEESNLRYFEQKNLDGVYVGQVNDNNLKWGRGALINNNNGNYFVGYWKNDKKNGKGFEYNKDGDEIASGEYKNGFLNGQGKKIFEDGTRYEGMFLDGKMDGNGTYFFKDGTQWQGFSRKGIKDGKGTFIDKDGNKSDMEYQNNVVV